LTFHSLKGRRCYPALNTFKQGQHSKMRPALIEAILHQGDAGDTRPRDRALVAHFAVPFRRSFLTVVVLASIALALDGDSVREQSLTKRVFCNCGCREVLAKCSHVECQARAPLKREISSAILQGKSDDRILSDLGMKRGTLVIPAFRDSMHSYGSYPLLPP
jgi:hypothetical protein